MKYLSNDQIVAVKEEVKRRMTCLSTCDASDCTDTQEESTASSSKTSALHILLGPEEDIGFSNLEDELETYLLTRKRHQLHELVERQSHSFCPHFRAFQVTFINSSHF